MKIAIIGGSIAGCALALSLKDKDGFEITIFERSKNLKSRGAGITMSKELFQTLLNREMIDSDTICYPSSSRSFYCQSSNKPEYGHCYWHQDISLVGLHWDTLFYNLRKRLPDSIYKNGCKIIEVKPGNKCPGKVTLESGETEEFDLIIFADGHQSLGRTLISESSQLAYTGYVAWRGTLDFELIKDKIPFIDNIPYYCFDTGHLLAYPVYHDNIKKLNWVFYEKHAIEKIECLGDTSPLNFSNIATMHLHQLANSKLPTAIAQIIIDTKSPFMQKIDDVCVDRLTTQGALLLGDASVVLRPHVGNGASMAIQDALSLSEHLCKYKDCNEAIIHWENSTLPTRLSTYALSKRMGDALVLKPVSWQGMDHPKMELWWKQILLGENWFTTIHHETAELK